MDTYKINIEGLDRELRKFPVNDKLDIAAFIMFGDIEMTEVAARELLKLVDDVISTGESLHALETLVEKTGANIVGRASVLAEGDAKDRDDIIFLSELPLFFK